MASAGPTPEGGAARSRALAADAGGAGHRLLDHVGVATSEDDRRALEKQPLRALGRPAVAALSLLLLRLRLPVRAHHRPHELLAPAAVSREGGGEVLVAVDRAVLATLPLLGRGEV